MADLSKQARVLLDEAGFCETRIVASSDLDEHLIAEHKANGSKVCMWGVGTKLVTAYDQPALGGVYKLAAIRDGSWSYKLKLSENPIKVSNPGFLQVRRFFQNGQAQADMIYDEEMGFAQPLKMASLDEEAAVMSLMPLGEFNDLLQPIFRAGRQVFETEPIELVRRRAQAQLDAFDETFKCLRNPHIYPTGLEIQLHHLKIQLIKAIKDPG